MPRTSTRLDISIPIPLSETYKAAHKAGKVRPLSDVCAEALETELRSAGLEPPPRPELNPRTAKATASRWVPKAGAKQGTKKKSPDPETTP